ncbi:MAG TPA: CpsD/CapB family tyrosine-protein kinase [Vicinamibacterales bacterium]|nr:CpsD/CapB family tyrosine-protein kinase [Vicinamibacterales bacterium]
MTRLSEALKRAAAAAPPPAPTNLEVAPPAADLDAMGASEPTTWQFAPVETMHVPAEPSLAAADARDAAPTLTFADVSGAAPVAAEPVASLDSFQSPDLPEAVQPDAQPAMPKPSVVVTPRVLRFGEADRDKLILGEGVDPGLVEQYRHLGAVMHHANKSSNVRSVMVTSALPSEGKTLTATNLALTLSESYQRRVLLIDADLRRPRMREMFALPTSEGLTDALTAPRGDRLPVHQVTPNLWVLTSGRMLPDPMSLLASPAMKQLIDDAMETFDWVVVDTPPVAILPDANLLAAMIDTTLLVVSARSTPYPMVQRAAQAIGPNRILGVVLNRAEKAGLSANYGYYGTHRYHAGPLAAKRRWFGWLRKPGGTAASA